MVRNLMFINDYAYPYGGISQVVFSVLPALKDNGYNVTLISGTGPESPSLTESGVVSICLNQPEMLADKSKIRAAIRSIWNQKAYNAVLDVLKKYDISDTVVLVHGYSKTLSSSIFAALKKTHFKVILTMHDYFAACPNGGFYDFPHKTLCHLKPMSLRCICCNCDPRSYTQKLYRIVRQMMVMRNMQHNTNMYAFCVSDLCKSLMAPYIAKNFKNFDVLLNPVQVNNGVMYDISRNDSYAFIGRLSLEKGIVEFCKVITELGLQGVVLGEGYLKDELKIKYPNISFVGWVDGKDKEKYLSQTKCVIFPSKVHETYGLTIPETLSYGIPIIVPTGCGATDLVQDGMNGFVYEMGDYEQLKAKVLAMESADIKKMSNYIRETFHPEDYSVNMYIKRLENIFDKIMKE